MRKKVYILSLVFLSLDILSKLIIKNTLDLYQSITIIPNFFNITYVKNIGAAFSILSGQQGFLILLGIFILMLAIYYLRKEKLNSIKIIYYSLIIGGIIGNLIDRIIYNGVIDFLDFKILGFDAPIFNLADTFICIGVFLIIIESVGGVHGNKSV